MIDKQAGNLEIDVFSRGKYAVTMNGKSSERKNRLEEMPHPDFISYLKLSRTEIGKVIFPTKEQIRNAFITVFAVVTVVSLFLALVDLIMSFSVSKLV